MRQHKTNLYLRVGIGEMGLRNWQAAEILGYSESYFSRIIRAQMPLVEQAKMLDKIKEGLKNYEKY